MGLFVSCILFYKNSSLCMKVIMIKFIWIYCMMVEFSLSSPPSPPQISDVLWNYLQFYKRVSRIINVSALAYVIPIFFSPPHFPPSFPLSLSPFPFSPTPPLSLSLSRRGCFSAKRSNGAAEEYLNQLIFQLSQRGKEVNTKCLLFQ